MEKELRAEICPKCRGRGVIAGTNSPCENCRGVGAIGTDGTYEYYLSQDEKGILRVQDIKETSNDQTSFDKPQEDTRSQSRKILRGLIFVIAAISYTGYLGIHFFWIKNTRILTVVSIITAGFLLLYLLYDFKLLEKIAKLILQVFIKEPNDFLAAVNQRSKKKN